MPEGSQPAYEIALTHFIVSDDVERSRRFYTEVLGRCVCGVERARRRVPHATETARDRDPLLHARPDGHLIEVGQTTLPGGWRQFLNP
jgi:hypothetical protein